MIHLFANRRVLIVAIIFLMLTWVMFTTSQERNHEGKLEYFFNTALAPVERVFNYLGGVVSAGWNTVTDMARLNLENESLREEVAYLKTRQLSFDLLEAENKRLRQGLGFEASQSSEIVAAEIIAVNPSNWSRTLTVNKGVNVGLKKNMAVISPAGVVGRILEVRAKTAEIILLNDPREGNTIGGVIKRTQSMVIVSGGGDFLGECTMRPAIDSFFTDLELGDLIITAEISDLFPRGIPIGKVVEIEEGPNKMPNRAIIQPMVDLDRLQTLYIVKHKSDTQLSLDQAAPGGK